MGFGLTGGVASASNSPALCIDQGTNHWCALTGSQYQWGVIMPSSGIVTAWNYPTTAWQNTYSPTSANTGYIQQAGTAQCLQIDEAAAGVVRMASCIGDEAEQWENWYNPTTKRTEFVSYYYYTNGGEPLCLSFDASGTDVPGNTQSDILKADPCLPGGAPAGGTSYWYQQWGSS